jgi:hypothetical protein
MALQQLARKNKLQLLQEAIKEADVQQEEPASSTDATGETKNFARWLDQSYVELQLMRDWLWRREQVEFHLPPSSQRLFYRERWCKSVIQDDNGTYTDYTTEASDPITADVELLPATPADDDAVYFGSEDPMSSLHIALSAGGGTWTITWQYWDGTAWTALTGVTDNTSGFRAGAGTHEVTWSTSPTDWARTSVNSSPQLYYVRAVVSGYSAVTAQPTASLVQIDGTSDYEGLTMFETNSFWIGPKYLTIRTLDSKSDLGVWDDDSIGKIFYKPYAEWRGLEDRLYSQTGQQPQFFTILPDKRIEFDKPADDDYGIGIDLAKPILEFSADTDYPDIPVELQDILIWMTVLSYMGWDEARDGYANANRRYQFYLKRAMKDWLPRLRMRPYPLHTNYD